MVYVSARSLVQVQNALVKILDLIKRSNKPWESRTINKQQTVLCNGPNETDLFYNFAQVAHDGRNLEVEVYAFTQRPNSLQNTSQKFYLKHVPL